MRSIWEHAYCAFCRVERRVVRKKHIAVWDSLGALLASASMTALIWQDFDPRGLVLFALLMVGMEIFILLRWRLALRCTSCGFDPVIYARNPNQASENVKAFIEMRASEPLALLKPLPKLPVRIKRSPSAVRENRVESSI